MSRPKTPQGNHWKCQRISAIEREQPLFQYLSCVEYVKATESYEKSLSVMKERHLTDRGFEASHTRASKWCIKI